MKAILHTSAGDITVELFPNHAPNTVNNFVTLAKGEREWVDPTTGQKTSRPLYDGTIFHRVIPGFMAQGGDPKGDGTGGSTLPDLKAEFNPMPHLRGTVSMARAQSPDSANSQFFICLDDATFLDNQYTVWGVVESGMEHVDALPKGEPPRQPGKIEKMRAA